MSFINPLILFGLAAVSVPILIHLFNLRKVQKVEFSTLMFIKELQKTKLKRIKLKQLILLLLRCLAIVFLVFAFAKPVFKGFGGSSSGQKTLIIFLDDSFSMNVSDSKGLYFDQSRDAVKKILDNYKENDEVYFIPTSAVKMKDKKIFFDSFQDIVDTLEKLGFSDKSASMDEVTLLANELLKTSKNLTKDVFVVSDFQKSNFTAESKNTLIEKIPDANIYLVNVGDRDPNNLSVDDFEVVSKIIDKDRTAKLRVNLNNHTKFNVSNKVLSLYVDGNKVNERVVDAGSLSKKEVEFEFKPNKTGNVNGYIELAQSDPQDDELINDNRIYFSLYIPEEFNVLMISENPDEGKFVEAALLSAENLLSDSTYERDKFVKLDHESNLDGDLSSYDLIFVTGKRSFSEDEAVKLKNFAEGGGGVFIFPTEDIDVNNYNDVLLSKLNSMRIAGLQSVSGDGDNQLAFEKMDFEHPLLSEVFKNSNLSITSENMNVESPKIRNYYELSRGSNANTIISLNNKKDFLIETNVGDGKVVLSSVPADLSYSNFPLKSLFAPLIIRSVFYLGNNYDYKRGYTVGDINIINTRNLRSVKDLITPSDETVEFPESIPAGDYFTLPYNSHTDIAGIYTFSDSAGNKFSFSLNKSPIESILEKDNESEIVEYSNGKGFENVGIITDINELQYKINEARVGKDLTFYFLLAALACVAAEMFLSRKMQDS
ncbi:MAG: BatA and WFA domain-containing protein [Ignavibacteriae bacterium]|nr:BatA and WFA domain-containing protein [Ignavibacteriota bacterium]MCB9242924.1 BatA domain-containing protein [Ignavibacteriales bacterium]